MQNFFRQRAPQEGAPYGIQPEVMDTYVKSCGTTSLHFRNCMVTLFIATFVL